MSREVPMTRTGDTIWHASDLSGGTLYRAPGFEPDGLSTPLGELIKNFDTAYNDRLPNHPYIGGGMFGRVYDVGGYAVKFSRGFILPASSGWQYDPGNILRHTQIAVSLKQGLEANKADIKACEHLACWTAPDTSSDPARHMRQVQVMERLHLDVDRPEPTDDELAAIRQASRAALSAMGISGHEVYLDIFKDSVRYEGGTPVVLDLMPTPQFGS